jgi:hypothetical protein
MDDKLEAVEIGDDKIQVLEDNGGMLASLNRAEIDIQITTARRYPRSIVGFKRQALEMATLDEDTAGSMFYVLPRSGKKIEGPSVRLAEVVGSAWGNMRYGARVVEIGDHYVTAQGAAFDLEKNLACTVEVRRRITDRNGRRYNDDMIGVTANAACSVALRQAIFKVVPFAYVKSIYEEAKKASLGNALTMEQRRQRALDWYAKIGAKPEHVLRILGRKGVDDITVDDLVTLQGFRTAIQDGETTLAQILADVDSTATAKPVAVAPAGLSVDAMLNGKTTGENAVEPHAEDKPKVPAKKGQPTEQTSLTEF